MKILITYKSAHLEQAGFKEGEEYEVTLCVAQTLIGSGWAKVAPENKSMGDAPENK